MSDNLRHWSAFEKTDPDHTKSFKRAGGFSGTAIAPIYMVRKMTERFGPCGTGWGMDAPVFTVQTIGDDVMVYCTAAIWYTEEGQRSAPVFGVGGDKVAGKNKYGAYVDDEAFKKAFTDALSNAMKYLGIGADVHMGLYDDNKYVNSLRREFEEKERGSPKPDPKPESKATAFWQRESLTIKIAPLADGSGSDWKTWKGQMLKAVNACPDRDKLEKLKRDNISALDGYKLMDSAGWTDIIQAFTAAAKKFPEREAA